MDATTYDSYVDNWTVPNQFIQILTDMENCITFYVSRSVGATARYISQKYKQLTAESEINITIREADAKPLCALTEYNDDMVNKILEAANNPPVATIHSIEEYKKWQDSL